VGGFASSDEDRRILWEQFVEVHGQTQETYDSSLRTLAAGAVGLTVSLATALHRLPASGVAAVVLFLASLALNLVSYGSAQLDMRARINCLREKRTEGVEGNQWTRATTCLNVGAGAVLVAGGVLLAVFIAQST
jgi:hypothetical protein